MYFDSKEFVSIDISFPMDVRITLISTHRMRKYRQIDENRGSQNSYPTRLPLLFLHIQHYVSIPQTANYERELFDSRLFRSSNPIEYNTRASTSLNLRRLLSICRD